MDDPGALVHRAGARRSIAFVPANQGWPQYWLRMPHMTVASDSMWNYDTNRDTPVESFVGGPRTSGSHGTVLELGRKYNVPLRFSIAQMSDWSPKHLADTGLKAMQERGRLQVGKGADITIFDPLKAMAESTFKQGEQGRPTSGIPYVVVNGQPKPGINDCGIPGTHAGHSHGKDSGEQAAEDPGAGEKK